MYYAMHSLIISWCHVGTCICSHWSICHIMHVLQVLILYKVSLDSFAPHTEWILLSGTGGMSLPDTVEPVVAWCLGTLSRHFVRACKWNTDQTFGLSTQHWLFQLTKPDICRLISLFMKYLQLPCYQITTILLLAAYIDFIQSMFSCTYQWYSSRRNTE